MLLALKNIFTPNKIGSYILILLSLLYIVMVVKRGAGDFHVYYKAAEALRLNRPVYGYDFVVSREEICGYSYPLFWALMVMLVGWLPLWLLDFLWLGFNVWLLFKIWDLLHYFLDCQDFTVKQIQWFNGLILIFSVRFILYNFDMSQVTILLLYLCLQTLKWLQEKKIPDWQPAFLTALGVCIKLIPLFLIPYFFWRGRWRVGVISLIFIVLLMSLPIIWTGWETFWELQDKWLATINPSNKEFTIQQNRESKGIYSLSAFLNAYLFDDGERLYGVRRHLWNVSAANLHTILNVSRLFFISLTLFFLRFPPFRAAPNRVFVFWEFSYMLIAILLIFPHQQKYAFLFLLPSFAYLIYFYWRSRDIFLGISLFWVWLLSTASTDGIIGKHYYNLGQYFKVITFACFLVIALLMKYSPKKLEQLNQAQPPLI